MMDWTAALAIAIFGGLAWVYCIVVVWFSDKVRYHWGDKWETRFIIFVIIMTMALLAGVFAPHQEHNHGSKDHTPRNSDTPSASR
jgi:biotin transporter BioY